jgi:alpha-beta hydrolase superfamily lysophospholipase
MWLLSFTLCFLVSHQAAYAVDGNSCSPLGKELSLPVTEWVAQRKPVKDIIVAVHGLTLYAGAFDSLASHLADRGFSVYALDMRGFGRWRNDGTSFGGDSRIHVGQSQIDLVRLVERIRIENPSKKIFFLGESQGANLAMRIVENRPELTNGAILASPCYRTRVHPSPRWLVDGLKELVDVHRPLNLEPYTRPYLTNDPLLTEKCDNDPLVVREMTVAELVKCLIENKTAIKNASKLPSDYPILMLAGTKDGVFKSTSLRKEVRNFGDFKQLSLQLLPNKGHLLLEHQPLDTTIGSLIDLWLDKQSSETENSRVASERKTLPQELSEVP